LIIERYPRKIREVLMGTATLGYPGGPSIAFRVDPDLIDWTWAVQTNVVETIGGRVIQVLGARLEDLTVQGSFGQDHSNATTGESWQQAQAFLTVITAIMEQQSADSNTQALMHPPAVFSYPPKGWRWNVYVKSLTDPDGDNSVIFAPGKANQRYVLTLFPVLESSALVPAGTVDGSLAQQSQQAVTAFMARISDGVGWTANQYTGIYTGTLTPGT
jgi:hypothetical protein